MTARLRDERGVTLIELLVASTIALVIFAATLAVFTTMVRGERRATQHNDAQDRARVYTDRLARDLRNLASPSIFTASYQARPRALDVATGYDLVFRSIDDVRPAGTLNEANVKRVRYCLNSSDPDRGVLYRQQQRWTDRASDDPPAMPSLDACPGSGWSTTGRVTDAVVNRAGGQDRALFVFDSVDPLRVSRIRTDLFVDPTPGRSPAEARTTTAVTLRNQNRVPTAGFDVRVTDAVQRRVILNGSASEDPEGMPLTFQWYLDPPSTLPDCSATPKPASCVDTGVVTDLTIPTPGSHQIVLLVRDPADLSATAEDTRSY
jgi:prepilin-type N-terminal cleavage/methylation domain-containing protein